MLVNVFPKEKVPKNTTQNNILIYMMYPVSGVIPAKRSIGGKIYYPQKSHYRCNNAIRSMLHVLPIEALHRKILQISQLTHGTLLVRLRATQLCCGSKNSKRKQDLNM
jgi:hypothetical protein